jgi:hypothetical protein
MDLGLKTGGLVKQMAAFNPGKGWKQKSSTPNKH